MEHFSLIAAPLYELLRKNTPFSWTKEREEAMNRLKEALSSAPVLRPPDDSDFAVRMRSSSVGTSRSVDVNDHMKRKEHLEVIDILWNY